MRRYCMRRYLPVPFFMRRFLHALLYVRRFLRAPFFYVCCFYVRRGGGIRAAGGGVLCVSARGASALYTPVYPYAQAEKEHSRDAAEKVDYDIYRARSAF